jgi:hypothetical protein
MKTITITGGNTSTGVLILSDRGHTKAIKGERIRWKVKNSADPVVSIEGVPLKANTTDIFSGDYGESPRKEDSKNWRADIARDVHTGDVCEYSIIWKDTNGVSHTFDPKISINPSFAPALLVSVVVGALAITYFLLRRFKRSR